ncbi:hypothetical protein FLT15_15470 [Paenibacillus thiaminolyticus]|uniref:hypothetical protein n=1 Tax=Paenibacillus thiaminolyticus TaxID=49283 RepID=UPI0013F5F52E|nr:hypothetical protein [Paenibacillus thiaminolyticus]NGP59704.1 hypothetical protein [Paenibacillus thiaminolyticus]
MNQNCHFAGLKRRGHVHMLLISPGKGAADVEVAYAAHIARYRALPVWGAGAA